MLSQTAEIGQERATIAGDDQHPRARQLGHGGRRQHDAGTAREVPSRADQSVAMEPWWAECIFRRAVSRQSPAVPCRSHRIRWRSASGRTAARSAIRHRHAVRLNTSRACQCARGGSMPGLLVSFPTGMGGWTARSWNCFVTRSRKQICRLPRPKPIATVAVPSVVLKSFTVT